MTLSTDLAEKITAVTSDIVFGGTYDLANGVVDRSNKEFLVEGQPLPSASSAPDVFLIVTSDGTFEGEPLIRSDWIVSDGVTWIPIPYSSSGSVAWDNIVGRPDEFPPADHNHDGDYAPIDHNHDGDYAPADHNHDTDYAPIDHNHDGDYQPVGDYITDAPNDGKPYVRKSEAWEEMPATGGGGDSLWQQNLNDIYYNDGNVGIGTDQPQGNLDVDSILVVDSVTGGNTPFVSITRDSAQSERPVLQVSNSSGPFATFDGNGLVGIGGQPGTRAIGGGDAKLQVDGDGYFSGNIEIASGKVWRPGQAGVGFTTPSAVIPVDSAGGYTSGTVDLGLEGYKWKDGHFSGTVNVGNHNIRPDGGMMSLFNSGDIADIHLGAVGGVSNGFQIIKAADDSVTYKFTSSGVGRVVIDSAGRVGIGGEPGTRAIDEAKALAKTKLTAWKAEVKKRTAEQPEASTQDITLEVTDGDFGVMPTEQALAEFLQSRAIGGGDAKLQVAGDGYFSGTVKTLAIEGVIEGGYGLSFNQAGEKSIVPLVAGAAVGGQVNLGTATAGRTFKDAHFSGTIYSNSANFSQDITIYDAAGNQRKLYTRSTDMVGSTGSNCTFANGTFSGTVNAGSHVTVGSQASGGYSTIKLQGSNNRSNWQIGQNFDTISSFTLTPSTSTGNTTFTTPVFILTPTGDATFSGTIYGKVADVPDHVKNITPTQIANWDAGTGGGGGGATTDGRISDTQIVHWDQAYSWGNHASAGYQPAGSYAAASHTHSEYLTSASLSGYATESWVSSQGFAKGSFVPTSGNTTIAGTLTATDFVASSDERLKDEITPMPVGLIDDIKPVQWTWKDSGKKSAGVVAQQLQEIGLDDFVTEGEDGMLGVNYNALVSVLLAEVISLKKELAK